MRKDLYFIFLLSLCSIIYGVYSISSMLLNNKTPYIISCDGILLDKGKIYAVSNTDRTSEDTIFINFEKTKAFMPEALGFLIYDRSRREFILKNNNNIFEQSATGIKNPFYPFCHTLNTGRLNNGQFFGPDAKISQKILIHEGIKYNYGWGDKGTRVALELFKTPYGITLKAKDDGIGTKYLLKADTLNTFKIYLNRPVKSVCPNVFAFDNTTYKKNEYTIQATPGLFTVEYAVRDSKGNEMLSDNEGHPQFLVNGLVFSITPKYTFWFTLAYLLFWGIIITFQIYLLRQYTNAVSPIIRSLIGFRILLNCIAFLAVPLFLTSYYLINNRGWYLLAIILLNFSYFLPKDYFSKDYFRLNRKYISFIIWPIILIAPLVFKFAASNENLFGIPILHFQKLVILLMFYATQTPVFLQTKSRHLLRIGLILLYSFIISLITHDIGSFIYTSLALTLVELIRKSIKLQWLISISITGAVIMFAAYFFSPDVAKERKMYRLVAPYVSPDSKSLSLANESDRESYSILELNMKNILMVKTPIFNDLVVPASMRSTMHSDFAFYWSIAFGNLFFGILYASVTLLIVSKLFFLLYCSIRECQVRDHICFTFPSSREAEFIRVLLAVTIISFIYPIASNLLLIPLTGQSIPVLSISNIEPLFLIILIVALENIFNNPKYYVAKQGINYSYSDVIKSIKWGLLILGGSFASLFIIKHIVVSYSPDSHYWKKPVTEDDFLTDPIIPGKNDKQGLIIYAASLIDGDDFTNINSKKRPLLKNATSLYYSGKPYNQIVTESKSFSNSTRKLIYQMTVDSLLSINKKIISGPFHPYGLVYSFTQNINNKAKNSVSHHYYSGIPLYSRSINADLTAECNKALESHLAKIGIRANIGSVTIVDNHSGGIIANSSYPCNDQMNSNEVYYLAGSLKKVLIAYCALKVDPGYRDRIFSGKSFEDFLIYSDDYYSACLLKDLLINYKIQLNDILNNDFDLPLFSLTEDSYLDALPLDVDFIKKLDRNNSIFRQSIGQQRPYPFKEVIQWYSRIAGNNKLELNYDDLKEQDEMSLPKTEMNFLKASLNNVLNGTAINVRDALIKNKINTVGFFCKTGTAEKASRKGNSSTSFIIADDNYTIGIMLSGSIPHNSKRLAAKDLFIEILPILIKYKVLNRSI